MGMNNYNVNVFSYTRDYETEVYTKTDSTTMLRVGGSSPPTASFAPSSLLFPPHLRAAPGREAQRRAGPP